MNFYNPNYVVFTVLTLLSPCLFGLFTESIQIENYFDAFSILGISEEEWSGL
jgi:hypothetical protein